MRREPPTFLALRRVALDRLGGECKCGEPVLPLQVRMVAEHVIDRAAGSELPSIRTLYPTRPSRPTEDIDSGTHEGCWR
jgi:hypothetical protein